MRILFVEASTGGVVGGSLTGLYHLIRGLHGDGWEAMMVLYETKAIERELADLGVPVFHVRRRRIPKQHVLLGYEGYHRAKAVPPVAAGLRSLRQTARLLAEEIPSALVLTDIICRVRPDVVHLGNGLRANFDGFLACLATGRPAVCHIKGFEKYGARERWASRRTKSLVCMTRAVLDHCLAAELHPPDARVVYDAVDASWLRVRRAPADVRRELGVPLGVPCLGLVGNIQGWKGQSVLVEAVGQLCAANVEVRALLIGGIHRAGAEYAAQVRRRVGELGLEDYVLFTGYREDVVEVMNAVDVVVHTSVRPEPFGRVILEGMLLGKPVVATAAGGVPELIRDGETGYLVPPGDPGALAKCLQRVLSDPGASTAVGLRAQAWARATFSLPRQVTEMKAVYEFVTAR